MYPIKSLGGIRLDEAVVQERGLEFDRRWMLVDKQGHFLTQRKHANMALLQVALSDEGLVVYHKKYTDRQILIPFKTHSFQQMTVTVWGDQVPAQLVDSQISRWFSEQLDMECDLVYMPDSVQRKVDPGYAVHQESVSFADAMPYLLIGQASLDDLNSRLDEPVPMNRFRPNLVIAGGQPFQEDEWERISIGSAEFKITKPCARCVLTTVDQQSAEKGKEPLKTLSKYRKVGGQVLFGQNMLLLSGGEIRTGDEVRILSRKSATL